MDAKPKAYNWRELNTQSQSWKENICFLTWPTFVFIWEKTAEKKEFSGKNSQQKHLSLQTHV